jgi:tRNA pseudouridine32 synthase/23S rRNA pseudouridine746 synthase
MLFFETVYDNTIYEDEDLLVIHKPSGIPSHTLKSDLAKTTAETEVKKTHPHAEILHRLDTGTSGLLMFAKNHSVYEEVRKLFQLRLIKKTYSAWSILSPDSKARAEAFRPDLPLFLDWPVAHHPKSKKRMIVADSPGIRIRGKPYPARTWVRSVQTEGLSFADLPCVEFQIEIETGVTHQIRVHLQRLGFPLMGDATYNKAQSTEPKTIPPRLGLHAHRLAFEFRGRQYQFEAPLPIERKALR